MTLLYSQNIHLNSLNAYEMYGFSFFESGFMRLPNMAKKKERIECIKILYDNHSNAKVDGKYCSWIAFCPFHTSNRLHLQCCNIKRCKRQQNGNAWQRFIYFTYIKYSIFFRCSRFFNAVWFYMHFLFVRVKRKKEMNDEKKKNPLYFASETHFKHYIAMSGYKYKINEERKWMCVSEKDSKWKRRTKNLM